MHINRKWGSNIKLIYAEDMTTVVEESTVEVQDVEEEAE